MLILMPLVLMVSVCTGQEYKYWSRPDIQLTSLFKIDYRSQRIVLAAKNSICHLTLDLQATPLNVQDATPSSAKMSFCETDSSIFQSLDRCQNFHHILHFPTTNNVLTLDNNETIPVNETILACGSDAYQPRCYYRNRTSLEIITSYLGRHACPYDRDTVIASIVSSNGNLVSGTSLNVHANKYGVTLSHSPYNGNITVRTIDSGFILFKEPKFVSVLERGEYYYFFMRETAAEVVSSPIYSRVVRFCKNDTGISNIIMPTGTKVLTTYIKARILCTSILKSANDFSYTFNDLQDTVHILNGTDNSEYLYGVFTSAENGPAGSAICLYTFDGRTNDLSNVFTKSYLRPTGVDTWIEQSNDNPVTCNGTPRSYDDAAHNVLMLPPVEQVGQPLVQEDGLLYQKLSVDQVIGLNGVKYDVFLIAATSANNLHFFKKTRVSSQQVVTSQSVILQRNSSNGAGQIVGKMELYKGNDNISVYVSTSEGLYAVSLTDCSNIHTSCRECVSSRDPYCAYDIVNLKCVSTLNTTTGNMSLLQDIVNGNISKCSTIPSSSSPSPSPSPTTSSAVILSTTSSVTIPARTSSSVVKSSSSTKPTVIVVASSTEFKPAETSSFLPVISTEPTLRAVNDGANTIEEHIWTIVAGIGGLILGVVIGVLLFALIRNKNRFRWGKFLSRRQRYDFDGEKGTTSYELSPTKLDQKNNSVEYSKVPQRSSTPPLSKLNPNGVPLKVTDSPVLTKYSNTGRRHNRSMSSGCPVPHFIPTNGTSTPLASSPMGPNLRTTFHVEEPVPNTQYQKYGHNMVGRQFSREYPMSSFAPNHVTTGCHMKTNSLDLDYDRYK